MIYWKNIRNFWNKSIRFGVFIPLSNLLLIYGKYLLSNRILLYIFKKRNLVIEKKIQNLVPVYPQNELGKGYDKNAPIWCFWLQGESQMPDIPRLCLQSIRKFSNGHPVYLLTWSNFREYVNIPSYIIDLYNRGRITPTHFSDILRMSLLSQNGGFWLDATMFITKPLPECIFSAPLFSIRNKPYGFFVSRCRWTGFCMASWANCILPRGVNEVLRYYWKKETTLIDYFIIDYIIDMLYQSNNEIKNLIDDIPYNNENVHELTPLLCDTFDEYHFQELTKETFLFKLNWRKYTTAELERAPNNYYHYLVDLVSH